MLLSFEQILDCLKISLKDINADQLEALREIINKHKDDTDFDSIPGKTKADIRNHPLLKNMLKEPK